jgi:hypothetical protein
MLVARQGRAASMTPIKDKIMYQVGESFRTVNAKTFVDCKNHVWNQVYGTFIFRQVNRNLIEEASRSLKE